MSKYGLDNLKNKMYIYVYMSKIQGVLFFSFNGQDAFKYLSSVETSPSNAISFWIKPTFIKSSPVKHKLFSIDPVI